MFTPKNEKPYWQMVFDLVADNEIGTVFPYKDISDVIGKDILENRTVVYQTNKHLLRDKNTLLVNVRNVGYKLVEGMDIMYHAENVQLRGKRQIKKAGFETQSINTIKLSAEEKSKLHNFMAFNANIRQAFAQKIDRIEKANQVSQVAQQFTEREIADLKEMLNGK